MQKAFKPLILIFTFYSLCFSHSPSVAAPRAQSSPKHKINTRAVELCQLAIQVASQEDYEAAVVYLKRALELEPKFPEALFNLASIYRSQKKYQDSYSIFQQLLMINPDDHEARLEKVLTLIGMKSYKAASDELQKVPSTEKRYASVKAKLDQAYQSPAQASSKAFTQDTSTSTNLRNALYEKRQNASPKLQKSSLEQTKTLAFSSPTGITTDEEGNIYVANFTTDTIEKLSADGSKRETFASGEQIAGPSGIVYDQKNERLLVCNYKAGSVVSVSKTGQIRLLIDKLEKPYALHLQQDGLLYVSEQGKKAVSIISLHPN